MGTGHPLVPLVGLFRRFSRFLVKQAPAIWLFVCLTKNGGEHLTHHHPQLKQIAKQYCLASSLIRTLRLAQGQRRE